MSIRTILHTSDTISERIFTCFDQKMPLQQISSQENVSIDQVKRLKRFYNFYNAVLDEPELTEIIQQIGLKILVLSPLFKPLDKVGLYDILSQTDADTTKTQLKSYLQSYLKKKAAIAEFEASFHAFSNEIQAHNEQLQKETLALTAQKSRLQNQLSAYNHYPLEVQTFLMEYVTPYRNGFALRKRVDSRFHANLKTNNIIRLNDEYIFEILSLETFTDRLSSRFKKNLSCHYDKNYELEKGYYASHDINYTSIKNHTKTIEEIEQAIRTHEQNIKKNLAKQKEMETTLLELKRAQHFYGLEATAHAANTLSDVELLKHKELEIQALKWLYMNGYVPCNELTLPNKRRADVIGYKNGEIIIIEVKVSLADFKRDTKWKDYLKYCHRFYFLSPFTLPNLPQNIGSLLSNASKVYMEQDSAQYEIAGDFATTIIHQINRLNAKRVIYGF